MVMTMRSDIDPVSNAIPLAPGLRKTTVQEVIDKA